MSFVDEYALKIFVGDHQSMAVKVYLLILFVRLMESQCEQNHPSHLHTLNHSCMYMYTSFSYMYMYMKSNIKTTSLVPHEKYYIALLYAAIGHVDKLRMFCIRLSRLTQM